MVKECAASVATTTDEQGVTHITLTPPRQEVGFNRFILHDDGLLVGALMEFEGLSYDDAEARIRQEVGQWKAALERREAVVLGDWGQLTADEECHWDFTPSAAGRQGLLTSARHYGLETLTMTGWQEPQPQHVSAEAPTQAASGDQDEEHTTHIVLPFNRAVLRRVAMFVLIVACCFVGFFLPTHQQQDSSRAGMIDSEILTGNRQPNITLHHSWEEVWDDEVARLEQEEAPTATVDTGTDIIATPAVVETTPAAVATEPTAEKLFYIIVGSCGDTAEADRQMARLQRMGITDAGVILKDDRYRICLRAYDDRATAEEALNTVREVEVFHDAWLLPARQATVTYISKIKYNEQLPMELSHLTTRTQRDQGGDHS